MLKSINSIRPYSGAISFLVATVLLFVAIEFSEILLGFNKNATPDEITEAVRQCPGVREWVMQASSPIGRSQLSVTLQSCLTLEHQRSALQKQSS